MRKISIFIFNKVWELGGYSAIYPDVATTVEDFINELSEKDVFR
jgi:hypothetical protein